MPGIQLDGNRFERFSVAGFVVLLAARSRGAASAGAREGEGPFGGAALAVVVPPVLGALRVILQFLHIYPMLKMTWLLFLLFSSPAVPSKPRFLPKKLCDHWGSHPLNTSCKVQVKP